MLSIAFLLVFGLFNLLAIEQGYIYHDADNLIAPDYRLSKHLNTLTLAKSISTILKNADPATSLIKVRIRTDLVEN